MIHIQISQNESGNVVFFQVSGHSGYAERGQDIVCAAVSSAVMMTGIGLEQQLGLEGIILVEEQENVICCRVPEHLPETVRQQAFVLTNTLKIYLEELASQYESYIHMEERKNSKRSETNA